MNARFLLAAQEKLLRLIATRLDASPARNRRNRHPWRLLASTGPLTISVFSMRSTLNLWALDKRQSDSSTPKAPRRSHSTLRAGVAVKIYPLEPLRDALRLPRVNLFVADDVGLGKTIEAGLIVRELLMPQKVRRVVICAPPSVVVQWRERMESRFGLGFVVLDREYVAACRRERGFGVNPWNTHDRFILSHALLRDETYVAPPPRRPAARRASSCCGGGSRESRAGPLARRAQRRPPQTRGEGRRRGRPRETTAQRPRRARLLHHSPRRMSHPRGRHLRAATGLGLVPEPHQRELRVLRYALVSLRPRGA